MNSVRDKDRMSVDTWADDLGFALRHRLRTGRERVLGFAGRALARWERAHPPSVALGRRLFGRTEPEPAAPLPSEGAVVEIDGIRMRIDPEMSEHNVRKLASGRHTLHERALLGRMLRDDDVVMELGGGIGMVAIACARRLGRGRVFSYEANPRLERLIRANYALNGVEPELAIAMLGPEPGTRVFHVAERFSRSSTVDAGQGRERIEVPVLSFDAELERVRPSVLVVDIQGGEAELLRDPPGPGFDGLRAVLIELHVDMIGLDVTRAVRRRLRDLGFRTTARSGNSFLYERAAMRRVDQR